MNSWPKLPLFTFVIYSSFFILVSPTHAAPRVDPPEPREVPFSCFPKDTKITVGGINGISTALGCLPTDPQALLELVFPWIISIGSIITFLMIIMGGFQYITAAGKPEQMDKAKELIVSALTGLVVIIFSVTLLKIIGIDILKIPGFFASDMKGP